MNKERLMKFWQVDSFTDKPFSGNPAAVFVLDTPLDDQLMQDITSEMNLSETAFILNREGKNPLLRWFTPMFEIDLCGHATLAAAHIYMTNIYPKLKEVTFDTKFVGSLKVIKNNDSYTMDFPSRLGEKVNLEDIPPFVFDALSTVKPIEAYQSRDLMLVYESEQTVREMKPNFSALLDYKNFIIVTAKTSGKFDFISRFFCADDGITEDPVTGSAHCTLAPYWAMKTSKSKLNAYQASKRGGELLLEMQKDRLYITGKAITVLEGLMANFSTSQS